MKPEAFLENVDLISEASNGIKSLRAYILKLAVQGRLVSQSAVEGAAADLRKEIEAQKKLLVKNGILKRVKVSIPISNEEIPYEIPSNWGWERVSDITHDLGQKKPDTTFTYIDVSSIDQSKGFISNQTQVLDPDSAPSRARKIVKKDTVLYSTVRPYLLNIAIVDKNIEPEPIASTAFAILHPYKGINNRYLFYYLRSQPFIDYVQKEMKGMAYPAINDEKMSLGLVPVPPFEEQKRIVAKVDLLMALCDELETKQEKQIHTRRQLNDAALNALLSAPSPEEFEKHWQRIVDNFDLLYDDLENLQSLRQAILRFAYVGKLTNSDQDGAPINWVKSNLGEHSILITKGSSPKWQGINYAEGGILFITSENVGNGRLLLNNKKFVETKFNLIQKRSILQKGDLLTNIVGASIGRSAIYDLDEKANINQAVALIRLKPTLNKKFTMYYLNSSFVLDFMEDEKVEGARANLSLQNINDIPINVPPLHEQKIIVDRIDQLMALCDELEKKLTAKSSRLEKLTESLLRS